jgi:DNA segregation ATPase FtsK/SpoIIIE-like protein
MMLIVDEANSYFDHKELFTLLTDLARRGRKWGLHLVLAGHNWRAKDVPRSLSAMFPTRICFRVTDDTSGAVVLNSRIWGKRAMHLAHPGRGILLMEGHYQFFQAYHAQEQITQAEILPPLTPLETRFVAYALLKLDGKFIVNRLAEAFAGEGVTSHQVKTLAQAWERRGWLTQPGHATDARRVTPELAEFAGLSRTSAQGAQVHPGTAYAAQELIHQEERGWSN